MKKIIISLVALSALTGAAYAGNSSSGSEEKPAAFYNVYGGQWGTVYGGQGRANAVRSDEAALSVMSGTKSPTDFITMKRYGIEISSDNN